MYSDKYLKEFNFKDFNEIWFTFNEKAAACKANEEVIGRFQLNFNNLDEIQTIINILEGLKFISSYDYDKELEFFSSKEEK